MLNDTVKASLIRQARKLARRASPDSKINLTPLPLHPQAGALLGHVLLDLLEESAYPCPELDALAAWDTPSLAAALAVMHAAGARGLDLEVVWLADPDSNASHRELKTLALLSLEGDAQNIEAALTALETRGLTPVCIVSLLSSPDALSSSSRGKTIEWLSALDSETLTQEG